MTVSQSSWSGPRRSWLVLAVVAVKVVMIVLVGPVTWPDSSDYTVIADAILRDTSWMVDADYDSGYLGGLTFRMVGYPLILAAARQLFGAGYDVAVICLQSALSVGLFVLLITVAARVLRFRAALPLVTVLYLISPMTIFDVSILTDSLFTVIVLGIFLSVLGAIAGAWRLGFLWAFAAGFGWSAAFLLRDSAQYFFFIVLFGIALWSAVWKAGLYRTLGIAAAFMVPFLIIDDVHEAWNQYRSGDSFHSTTATNNWLRPVFELKALGLADPFTGDDPVSDIVREMKPPPTWPEYLVIMRPLQLREELRPFQLERLVREKYLETVFTFPFAYAQLVVFRKYQIGDTAFIAFDPSYQLDYLVKFSSDYGARLLTPKRELRARIASGDAGAILEAVAKTVLRAVALALLGILFVGGFVHAWRLVRRSAPEPHRDAAVVFCWFAFFSWSLAFAMVHREDRHLLPVLPLAWLGALMIVEQQAPVFRAALARLAARRRRHDPPRQPVEGGQASP